VPSYNLLSELSLKHKSHNYSSSLSELLPIITLTNINSIIRTKQTKHIKNKAITVTKALKKVLKAVVTLKAITVFKKIKTITDIIY
jgi:hypothetical protein